MLIPFTIAFTIIIIFFFFQFGRPRATCNSPPSPPGLPLIGNLHQLGSLPHRSLQALSNKYGPIMLLHMGRVPTIVVSSPDMACEVMKTHDLTFASRPSTSMAKLLLYGCCDIGFAPYGEYWRQARKVCVLHLLSIKVVQSFWTVREDEVSMMIDMIRASSSDLVNLSKLFVVLNNDIICRVALGRKYYGGEEGVRNMISDFLRLLGSFQIGDFIPSLAWVDHLTGLNSRARKTSRQLDCFLDEVIEEHVHAKRDESNGERKERDFVDVLLSLDEKDESVGISLSRDNIKAITLVRTSLSQHVVPVLDSI